MDKGLTVPVWLLIFWPKTPQMRQNLCAQFVCLGPKVLNFNEKSRRWAFEMVFEFIRTGLAVMDFLPYLVQTYQIRGHYYIT